MGGARRTTAPDRLKHFCHPAFGELALPFEAGHAIPTDPGLTLSTEPGTPSHDSLKLLASWAATLDQGGQPDTATARGEQSAKREPSN
ncbi:hypothetical protein [Streptomyces sp. NPDC057681]|uniref:hypothetical protein n=1 Tax=unclassified Streptomyces TaxID=2593676 RepID=UPI00369A99AE